VGMRGGSDNGCHIEAGAKFCLRWLRAQLEGSLIIPVALFRA